MDSVLNIDLKTSKLHFTRAGFYLFLFTLGLASSSFVTGTNVLFLLNFFLFSVLLFNLFYLLSLRRKSLQIEFPRILLEEQEATPRIHGVKLPPLAGNLTLRFDRFGEEWTLDQDFLYFGGREFFTPLNFGLRGEYRFKQIEVTIEFPFPLFQLTVSLESKESLMVAPKAASLPLNSSQSQAMASDNGGDLHRIKPYSPGDPIKTISWKHYARVGELMVKEFENLQKTEDRYLLAYSSESEKRVFAGVLNLLETKIQRQEPFSLLSRHGRFHYDGRSLDLTKLLVYLARYESPTLMDPNYIVLGEGA